MKNETIQTNVIFKHSNVEKYQKICYSFLIKNFRKEFFMKDFAQKIRLYKAKLDISNKDLAERTGLPVTTISRICSGNTKSPTLNTVKLLAKALECSVEELMDYTDGVAPYFFDETTASLAQELKENKELKVLLDSTRDLPPEDLQTVINMINMLKRN